LSLTFILSAFINTIYLIRRDIITQHIPPVIA
jgi:hypothetical protein